MRRKVSDFLSGLHRARAGKQFATSHLFLTQRENYIRVACSAIIILATRPVLSTWWYFWYPFRISCLLNIAFLASLKEAFFTFLVMVSLYVRNILAEGMISCHLSICLREETRNLKCPDTRKTHWPGCPAGRDLTITKNIKVGSWWMVTDHNLVRKLARLKFSTVQLLKNISQSLIHILIYFFLNILSRKGELLWEWERQRSRQAT